MTDQADQQSAHRRARQVAAPDGTKYRVVAAKKGLPFKELSGADGGASLNPLVMLLEFLLGIIADAMLNSGLEKRTERAASWKVAIVRYGWWREKFVHKELLAPGVDPGERMDELVDAIALGLGV